jgi:hypothetical protein
VGNPGEINREISLYNIQPLIRDHLLTTSVLYSFASREGGERVLLGLRGKAIREIASFYLLRRTPHTPEFAGLRTSQPRGMHSVRWL